MKRDLFCGNIKPKYVSYIWATIIVVAVVFFGCGGLFLYLAFFGTSDSVTSMLLLALGVAACLYGLGYSCGTVFVIRTYPKHPKLVKWFLNSDDYFVGCNTKEYCGHWRGKAAFDAVSSIADQNDALSGITYPKTYYACAWATAVGIVLMFATLIGTLLCLNHMEALPSYMQSETMIFYVSMGLEALFTVLSFVFAFRVKRIRMLARKAYLEKQMAKDGEAGVDRA